MGKQMEFKLKLMSGLSLVCCAFVINLLHGYLLQGRFLMLLNVAWIGAFSLFLSIFLWNISQQNPADSHTLKSILIQYALMSIMCKVGSRYTNRLKKAMENVKQHQNMVLKDILVKNSDTVYGKRFKFGGINDRKAYIQYVPLVSYADIQLYVNEIVNGKQGVLTRDDVIYLAETSGTTGKCKIIPITHDMKGPSAMKVGPLMYHFMDKCGKLDLQRVFILSYRSRKTTVKCGLMKGPVSSHMSRYVPFVVSPREVYELEYEQTALHVHAVFALQEKEIGHMEALMTTLVYSFWLYLDHYWELVCNDIESGKLTNTSENKNDMVYIGNLQRYLTPNPVRAKELREQFKQGMFQIAKRIWPNLLFARMLNTGGFAHHANVLRKYYMNGIKQLSQAHAASEGFLGFNLSENADDNTYAAMIDYGFLEFIPEENIHERQPATFFTDEVKCGGTYEMVLTTPMGLYRYRTGDVVKIVDYVNNCPVYEFHYRVGQLLNLFWEKTPESVFYYSVEQTIAKLKSAILVDYTVTEDVHTTDIIDKASSFKRYVMFVEVRGKAKEPLILKETDLNEFDGELCRNFEMYKKFRDSGSIGCMQVFQLRAETFLQLKSIIITSSQSQQYKVPRVIRNKEYLKFLWDNRLEDV